MNDNIKIEIYGAFENYTGGNRFLSSIKQDFRVENIVPEFSNFDGEQEAIVFTFKIQEYVLKFLGEFIIREAGKYVFKKFVLSPFFKKLEELETLNEDINVGYFIFEYEDIVIKIGYSRKNHLNVVSLINVQLIKRVPYLRSIGSGHLNLIATPVIWTNKEWHFYDNPPITTNFASYLKCWGLEFNEMNRAVYELKDNSYFFEYWWD